MDSKNVVLYRLRILVSTCMYVCRLHTERKKILVKALLNKTGFFLPIIPILPLEGNFEIRKIKSDARIGSF